MKLIIAISIALIVVAGAFKTPPAFRSQGITRVRPVNENFFLDVAEDPAINTPREIFGEVAYKSFVAEKNPDGLLVREYNIIERIRQLKLLTATADSGLLEALEQKGLTLSTIEKLLPVADDLGLLPLAIKNKELILSAAPLLIEPAPALLPVLANIIKTPASTFLTPGAIALLAGAYETTDNLLLAIPLILVGLPLTLIGSILNSGLPIPASTGKNAPIVLPTTTSNVSAKISAPKISLPNLLAPSVAVPTISAPAPKVATTRGGGTNNGRRKTIKVKVK